MSVGGVIAPVLLHLGVPHQRQIIHGERAVEQTHLNLHTHHDMQVVGDLVGFNTYQAGLQTRLTAR